MIKYLFVFFFSIITILSYVFIARKKKIFDIPNLRSSHTKITVRGAGIIIPLIVIFCDKDFIFKNLPFLTGLLLVAIVSFIDDIKSLSNKMRFLAHIFAVLLIFFQFKFFNLPIYFQLPLFILYLGIINAVNFMDGINGISGIYGFVFFFSIFIISQKSHISFDSEYLKYISIALIAFLFFNLRNKAICFLGDVGSVSMAFIFIYFISEYYFLTNDLRILFFLILYGIDTSYTMIYRLIKKENIFSAHKSHLYQLLVNVKNISPVLIALLYGIIQLAINFCIIYLHNNILQGLMVLIIAILYHFLRKRMNQSIEF
ncbi:MAG: UDP-GlcNAc--UDP-phosphate GlcNAc-1-phosphate transferase [Bacteroidetes bacterium]|nr:UDP-GlcNAc--UDP-phosphate GlcNAc-1-phosphate transferase [Bacteroidota bacterium]